MKKCFILCGPTAVGKTTCSIRLAQAFQTEIISADSRQCYRELNIGVAKPSEQQLALVPHYFINSHSIFQDINAAGFAQYAEHAVSTIFKKNEVAIMVGGTGLYINAFAHGFDDIPEIDPVIRNHVRHKYLEEGITWLKNKLIEIDPLYSSAGEMSNPQRMMRALEVMLSTGVSIRNYHQKIQLEKQYAMVKIGLELPREELYQHINQRVDDMMSAGLLQEAEKLLQHKALNALNTVGYKELFNFFEGRISLDEAVARIKQNTRHYAKRQLTWFKRDYSVKWFRADDHEHELLNYCTDLVNCQ